MFELPILPACVPTARGRVSRWLGVSVLKLLNWKIKGTFPQHAKFVIAVAPHTSNWDFVIAVATMLALNLKVKFMGKKAIFIWPFKTLLEKLGGIAIERNAQHGVVRQMVDQFKQSEQLVLALAPEGTRKKTKHWKSGFLHIAHQANVPVIPVSLDFETKEVLFHKYMIIGHDIDEELMLFKQQFTGVCAKNPQAVDI